MQKGRGFLEWLKNKKSVRYIYSFIRYYCLTKPFFSSNMKLDFEDLSFYIDYSLGLYIFREKHNPGYNLWFKCCRNASVIYDVGAHIGLYAIPALLLSKKGTQVCLFEPSSANMKFLKKHLNFNACTNAIGSQVLVGDVVKEDVSFYESGSADSRNSFVLMDGMENFKTQPRKQITLDSFSADKGFYPDLVKIDVEGAEVAVLRGMLTVLQKSEPVIFLSVHPRRIEKMGDSMEEIQKVFTENAYKFYDSQGNEVNSLKFEEYIVCKQEKYVDLFKKK